MVGYGSDAGNKYLTTYCRRELDVTEAVAGNKLALSVVSDDGAARC